jgi:hypothetical protein
MYSVNDLYVAIEVNADGVEKTEPMTLTELSRHISDKYRDQPLQYFNEHRRLKIIHLKTGDVKVARLDLVF